MIHATRLGGGSLRINAELIQTVEETPDTLLTMSNHDRILVRESAEEIVARVIAYRRTLAQGPDRAEDREGGWE